MSRLHPTAATNCYELDCYGTLTQVMTVMFLSPLGLVLEDTNYLPFHPLVVDYPVNAIRILLNRLLTNTPLHINCLASIKFKTTYFNNNFNYRAVTESVVRF